MWKRILWYTKYDFLDSKRNFLTNHYHFQVKTVSNSANAITMPNVIISPANVNVLLVTLEKIASIAAIFTITVSIVRKSANVCL